jgi:hypothetical protein
MRLIGQQQDATTVDVDDDFGLASLTSAQLRKLLSETLSMTKHQQALLGECCAALESDAAQ